MLYPFLKKGISQNECNKLVITIIDEALKAKRKINNEEKYEVIIPERIYIVNGLEEVRMIREKYKLKNVCIRLIK